MSITYTVSTTVQTPTQFTASGASAAGLKPGKRTFSLTGVLGTGILNGDCVAIWGSNDGGSTYQPLRQNGAPVQLNYQYPEVVIDDCCDHYATNRVSVAPGSTLAAVGLNGEATGINASPAWVRGGNAGFGPTGVLGTTDSAVLSVIAEGIEILNSDGVATLFGNPDATSPGNSLQLYNGSGGGIWNADNGGVITLNGDGLGTGGVIIDAGSGGILLRTTGQAISMLPAAAVDLRAQAGNTTALRFWELDPGPNWVGFKAPAAIAANVSWTLPNADATLLNKALVSDATGNLSFANAIQSGAANLTNGVSAAIAANITATSRIFIQAADVVPGAGNLTIDYRPLAADRVNGTPGSFKITAVLADGTINALDQSQGIMWMVLNA